jgi:outer membrane immunogenic protein
LAKVPLLGEAARPSEKPGTGQETDMRRVLFAGALSLAIATVAAIAPVVAADLPQPPPPMPRAPAFVPVPVYNWSGLYVGINGGYGFGSSNWTNSVLGNSGNFDLSGGVVGGTIGANWQFSQFVIGVEGDIDWSGIKGSTSNGLCAGIACTTKNTWLSTFRARAGFAADRVLFYGTAGGAVGSIQASGAGFTNTDSSQFGWTAGAGLEGALTDNLTARIEYLYIDLGNNSCSVVCFGTSTNVSFKTSLVRAGLDWKFGGF